MIISRKCKHLGGKQVLQYPQSRSQEDNVTGASVFGLFFFQPVPLTQR